MTTTSGAQHVPPVATVLEPAERSRVDAMSEGLYRTIHRNSVHEVMRDLKERRISAVLVSVARCVREEPRNVAAVVREFPRIPTVAVLSAASEGSAEAVLTLGNCGVQTLVDVREPIGWCRLRELLGVERTTDVDRMATAALRLDLTDVEDDCWRFFEVLFSPDQRVSTVRQLAQRLHVLPSTLMSRFFRARLPAPKRYLAFARLIRAASMFENPGLSVADVSNHLDYSSPQSFGRHVRTFLHLNAGEFRRTYDAERMLQRFRQELILPEMEKLRTLRPLAVRPGMRLAPVGATVRGWRQRPNATAPAFGRRRPSRASER
jgi:AraC-like DNA-binding protein